MVFTGIVTRVGIARYLPQSFELEVKAPGFFERSTIGESVSVNGVCLTITEFTADVARFGVMEETRQRTTLADNTEWTEVNLEPALKLGSQLGGHLVSGHVDSIAPLCAITERGDGSRDLWIDVGSRKPKVEGAAVPIVFKGSICLDGVSLTVAEWNEKEEKVRVSLIPHTLSVTTLGKKKEGDLVNVEFDRSLEAISEVWWPEISMEQRQRQQDEEFMRQAILLGEKGRLTSPPNPWVACILVKDGRVLGRGFHAKAGTAHAEVVAIQNAKENGATDQDLQGSTAYVTLEPCHHYGRTPPCDLKLIEHKLKRVVVAFTDPDVRVRGQGLHTLREAGIEVSIGVCEQEARKSFAPYIHHRVTGKPFVVVKAATSLDGRIACGDGTSQWITGEAARQDAHRLRGTSQAIIVGSATALKDQPRLNIRGVAGAEGLKPLRVVLDSSGKVTSGPLMDTSIGPTLIFTTKRVSERSLALWKEAGVESVVVKEANNNEGGGVDLEEVLAVLGKRGILQVLVEGGGKLQSSFLAKDLVDRVVLYYGACLLGGSGLTWTQGPATLAETISKVKFWKLDNVRQLDNDVCLEYSKPRESSL
jgi:diaminohydroxyphosphoribosylaminopyrimidine deaminase/5-amino-6-(5-phosphoribosylamino)uracil reductase